jgi:hypothetical protein
LCVWRTHTKLNKESSSPILFSFLDNPKNWRSGPGGQEDAAGQQLTIAMEERVALSANDAVLLERVKEENANLRKEVEGLIKAKEIAKEKVRVCCFYLHPSVFVLTSAEEGHPGAGG